MDLFSRKGRDQLGDIPLDPTSGYFLSNRYSYLRNGASFRGKGMDFALNTINTQKLVRWQSNLLLSWAKDEVTSYDFTHPTRNFLSPNSPPALGKPVRRVYSYKWAGLNASNGDPMIAIGGQPSKDYVAIVNQTEIADLAFHEIGRASCRARVGQYVEI